jgi:Flp pilus assembly pilin Flp
MKSQRVQHYNRRNRKHGQALVEYALVLVLVSLGVGAAIAMTGPAVGSIFSNVITGMVAEPTQLYKTMSVSEIQQMATNMANITPIQQNYLTNTPPAPTCSIKIGYWVTTGPTNQPPTYTPNC